MRTLTLFLMSLALVSCHPKDQTMNGTAMQSDVIVPQCSNEEIGLEAYRGIRYQIVGRAYLKPLLAKIMKDGKITGCEYFEFEDAKARHIEIEQNRKSEASKNRIVRELRAPNVDKEPVPKVKCMGTRFSDDDWWPDYCDNN